MKTALSRFETSIDGLYPIATASQLTGIPVKTILAWESRHAVVQPTRNAGNVRLYRRPDIERSLLAKAAFDAAQAVSTVAALTDRQIKARFKDARASAVKTQRGRCNVQVAGPALASVLTAAGAVRMSKSLG